MRVRVVSLGRESLGSELLARALCGEFLLFPASPSSPACLSLLLFIQSLTPLFINRLIIDRPQLPPHKPLVLPSRNCTFPPGILPRAGSCRNNQRGKNPTVFMELGLLLLCTKCCPTLVLKRSLKTLRDSLRVGFNQEKFLSQVFFLWKIMLLGPS